MFMSAIKPAERTGGAMPPLGCAEELGIYAYVGNDPVNLTDPLGLCNEDRTPRYAGENCDPIVVTGRRTSVADFGFDLEFYSRRDPFAEFGEGLVRWISNGVEVVRQEAHGVMCAAPALGAGGAVDAYFGLGASGQAGLSFNPRNGEITGFLSVGLGIGWGAAAGPTSFVNAPSGTGGSISANVGGAVGAVSGSVSRSVISNNGNSTSLGAWRAGKIGSQAGFVGYANVSGDISHGSGPLYDIGC